MPHTHTHVEAEQRCTNSVPIVDGGYTAKREADMLCDIGHAVAFEDHCSELTVFLQGRMKQCTGAQENSYAYAPANTPTRRYAASMSALKIMSSAWEACKQTPWAKVMCHSGVLRTCVSWCKRRSVVSNRSSVS